MNEITQESPKIEWAELMTARSWDRYWMLTWEKAAQILWEKWVEIWKTYEAKWRYETHRIKIDWISDDVFWFDKKSSEEDLRGLRANRASIWVTIDWQNWTGYLGYLREFQKRPSWAKWFILWNWNEKIIYDEVEDDGIEKVTKDINTWVLDLL